MIESRHSQIMSPAFTPECGFLDPDGWLSRYARFSVTLPAGQHRLTARAYCPEFEELAGNALLIVLNGELLAEVACPPGSGWVDIDIPLAWDGEAAAAQLVLRTTRFHQPPPPDKRLLGLILHGLALHLASGQVLYPEASESHSESAPEDASAIFLHGLCNEARLTPYLPEGAVRYAEEGLDAFAHLPGLVLAAAAPFFDAPHYLAQIPNAPALPRNPLLHFLRHGLQHRLSPHPLIDLGWMVSQFPDLAPDGSVTVAAFARFLASDVSDPSPFLDLAHVARAMVLPPEQSTTLAFLREGAEALVSPNPWFDPVYYARQSPEVPAGGMERIRHFLSKGDAAFLRPSEAFDPKLYAWRYHIQVTEQLGPLLHYLSIGRLCGYTAHADQAAPLAQVRQGPPTADFIPEELPQLTRDEYSRFHASANEQRLRRLAAFVEHDLRPVVIKKGDHAQAVTQLRFDAPSPRVDILIPVYNQFELTVECLVSLAQCHGPASRVILADDASTDRRMARLKTIPGLVFHRSKVNQHFLRSCNAAMQSASAPYLLLLNNDTQLLPGSLEALVAVLDENPDAAAAGPMLLYPNGRLQEAGCTLRHDGDSTMVGVGDDPQRACYNYRREVSYISGACLLLRRSALEGMLFDDRFAPAYCEDADLCLRLRDAGHKVIYEPAAKVLHHLSASTSLASHRRRVQGVRANQQKLMEKWSSRLRDDNRLRVLAFYLPQFHPVAQNDLWWGRGFTEWRNVVRALPSFAGHYQPHLPADLGFYDLRLPEVMVEQQRLARRYGIEGFIVYHYRLGDGRILDRPMEQILARPELDVRFAPCWANENWTRHWDGGARSLLLDQRYDAATLDAIGDDMLRMARDPRAITVNGKPLILVYRPHLIPESAAVMRRIRQLFEANGLPDPYLALVESMEGGEAPQDPSLLGFDASVEFPPHGVAEPWAHSIQPSKAGWNGRVYDYAGTALAAIDRPPTAYRRHPGIMPGWDNTARQPLTAHVLHGNSPALFQAYAEHKIEEALDFTMGEERLLFVNAWNEWAEGAHMEPDLAFGHRWLAALRQALRNKGCFA